MNIQFEKFQGTGNDFIMLDGIKHPEFAILSSTQIAQLCHRRFGIGADGLILLKKSSDADFLMAYYNADGHEGSMCGNGGRCAVFFAYLQKYVSNEILFQAIDGIHHATILEKYNKEALISLSLNVQEQVIELGADEYFLDTGSPHHVRIVHHLTHVDALSEGRTIRYQDSYKPHGVNVNFVEFAQDFIKLSTYERGVEDLTFSCGTGVTAAAIVAHQVADYAFPIKVVTAGGTLEVTRLNGQYYLSGQACQVFTGEINL